jgi:hypothetical protein
MSNTGYLYRIAPYTAMQALNLATQLQNNNPAVWWVSASQQWDVKTSHNPNDNLRNFTKFVQTTQLNAFAGDFGRIFCEDWELRWKRLDDGQYDLLILTEQADLALPAEARRLAPKYTIKQSGEHNLLVHNPEPENRKQQLIDYVEYLAKNQAVVFVRYKATRKEEQ